MHCLVVYPLLLIYTYRFISLLCPLPRSSENKIWPSPKSIHRLAKFEWARCRCAEVSGRRSKPVELRDTSVHLPPRTFSRWILSVASVQEIRYVRCDVSRCIVNAGTSTSRQNAMARNLSNGWMKDRFIYLEHEFYNSQKVVSNNQVG